MILQTTGGFSPDSFTGELFPLGSWCRDERQRTLQTAEDLSPQGDLDVYAESARLIWRVEELLYPALNSLHNVAFPHSFWQNSLGTYLRMLVPLLVRRSNLIRRARDLKGCTHFTAINVPINEVIPDDRPSMLGIVNSHAWNHVVLAELCKSLGLVPVHPNVPITLQHPDRMAARKLHPETRSLTKRVLAKLFNLIACRSSTLIARSMLPARIEFGLSLQHGTLPFYWSDNFAFSDAINRDVRNALSMKVTSGSMPDDMLLKVAILNLPRIFVEDFARARNFGIEQLPKFPRVIFTANLHQASDIFLLRLSEAKLNGSKIVIAQHGGVHSLCKNVPGDIQSERELADRYITWGSPTFNSPTVVPGPTLVNIGSRKRQQTSTTSETLLIVADSTYRYPSVPRGMNGSRFAYVDLLNDLIRKLNPSAIKRIVLRPYRGSEIWDDPFTSLLDHDVRVEVDTTFPPIQDRFDDARLVVSTSLGTTFFQTLHQQIPTAILLDREMSAVCDEANDALSELERGSILFADTTRLASHLNSVFLDVDSWWWNATTQQCIYEFESVLSPSTSTPTSFYGSVLRVARTGWVV